MNEHTNSDNLPKINTEETFHLLSELHLSPHLTQRELSKNLNISLGKTNYLIRQLVKKGMLKVKSFSRNPEKLKKVQYILTKKGLQDKVNLTYHFLKRKEAEFNNIKEKWEQLNDQLKKDNIKVESYL